MSDQHIEKFAAPQLLGAVWNWLLYGVFLVQFYVYSYNFPQDSTRIRTLVYSIFFLETVQTVLSGADLYHWFATSNGNKDQLITPFASFFDPQILGSVVSLSVQFFFAYRIRVLSRLGEKRSRWLCVIICLISIIGALGAFIAGIISRIETRFMVGLQVLEITWLVANTLSDLLIASAMLYNSRMVWGKDGYLNALVSIVRLTVESNLVTTCVSVVSLIMMAVFSEKIYYLCPYSNTLLVSLNNRISIRDASDSRGVVIDREVEVIPDRACSEATMDTIILEAVKPQENLTKQPVV